MNQSRPILEVSGLNMRFGGLSALSDVDFVVPKGVIKSVIGPNGAGKTTLFNLITAVHTPLSGRLFFQGQSITHLKPYQCAALGICRTFQTVELFTHMTVLQNVMVGRHSRSRSGLLSSGFRIGRVRREERSIRNRALETLERLGLAHRAHEKAGALPLGEQKALEIARALAAEPKLLLLDEPAGGLNETETKALAQLFRDLQNSGITILLVEHDVRLVMQVSDEVLVLNFGRKIADDKPEAVAANPEVIQAYLGEEVDYA